MQESVIQINLEEGRYEISEFEVLKSTIEISLQEYQLNPNVEVRLTEIRDAAQKLLDEISYSFSRLASTYDMRDISLVVDQLSLIVDSLDDMDYSNEA